MSDSRRRTAVPRRFRVPPAIAAAAALAPLVSLVLAADTVPTDVEQPGTQTFFLVVADDTAEGGSYGSWLAGGSTDERDEASGLPTCDYPRNLAGVTCE